VPIAILLFDLLLFLKITECTISQRMIFFLELQKES